MKIEKFARDVVLASLETKTIPKDTRVPTIKEVCDILKKKIDSFYHNKTGKIKISEHPVCTEFDVAGRIVEVGSSGYEADRAQFILLKDLIISGSGEYATFLFHHGTTTGTDAAYIDMESGKVVVARRGSKQANAYACHVVVNLTRKDEATYPGSHRATVERMPGMSMTQLVAVLNRTLLHHCKDNPEYIYNSKLANKERSYRVLLNTAYARSSSLKRLIETGTLEDCVFVKKPKQDGNYDPEQFFNVLSEQKHVELNIKGLGLDAIMSKLGKVYRVHGYDYARVAFASKDRESPERVKIDLKAVDEIYNKSPETVDPREDDKLFTHAKIITAKFESELPQCHDEVSNDVRIELLNIIEANKHWL